MFPQSNKKDEDNIAAIMMINQKRPTSRTRHMEYQWYAIQEWKEQGLVKCHYIPTADNSSDNLTKGLARILHHRHARRAMGHFGSPYSKMFPHLKIRSEDKQECFSPILKSQVPDFLINVCSRSEKYER